MSDAYSFTIRPTDQGWTWSALDGDGARVLASGRARTRAEAAALVVRFIARSLHPGSVPPGVAEKPLARAA